MTQSKWGILDSDLIYGIGRGDLSHLKINDKGELELVINGQTISFVTIMEEFRRQLNVKRTPTFTLRIPQLIDLRTEKMVDLFELTMKENGYKGKFQPLYPIKVNQRKQEVNTVMRSHPAYGLEAGTKSELALLLQVLQEHKHRIIMCNGVKDLEYVQIVKEAIDAGYSIYISIESVSELNNVLKLIPKEKLNLILRIKPYIHIEGHWGHSAGRDSKFGLSIGALVEVLDRINENDSQDQLIGLHAHPGSQITNSDQFAYYVGFLAEIYKFLHSQGYTNLKLIDVGGGFPIDYESNLFDQTLGHFITKIIKRLMEELEGTSINHPTIMIESGRAITAHSSIIVVQPIDYHLVFPPSKIDLDDQTIKSISLLNSVNEIIKYWNKVSLQPPVPNLFELKKIETRIGQIKKLLRKRFFQLKNYHEYISDPAVQNLISPDSYLLGNFSVFNGALDHVLVKQYFPIIPTIDLQYPPETITRLVDITCDSDGEISIFMQKEDEQVLQTMDGINLTSKNPVLVPGFPVPKVENIHNNYLTIQLLGAYQDVIEADHNLVGDLADVEIRLTDNGWQITIIQSAQKIKDIVASVGYVLENLDDPYIDSD